LITLPTSRAYGAQADAAMATPSQGRRSPGGRSGRRRRNGPRRRHKGAAGHGGRSDSRLGHLRRHGARMGCDRRPLFWMPKWLGNSRKKNEKVGEFLDSSC